MSYEDQGFEILSKANKKPAHKSAVDEARLLGDLGAFGLNTFVIGLGALTLSRHKEAGADIMKLGALFSVAGFGVKFLASGKGPFES